MRLFVIGLTAILGSTFSGGPAGAWMTANRYGGSTLHAYGEGTVHTNAYGGSTAHGWDGGTTHTNTYGGTTSGTYGSGVTHTTESGATGYRPPYPAAPSYAPYHPPVAVPYYASGCPNCGGVAAGAVVGLAAGAAIASASSARAAGAYSSGYAAGTVNAPAAVGVNYANLPSGSVAVQKGGGTYYLNGNTWFQPEYGANGVYFRVVPAP